MPLAEVESNNTRSKRRGSTVKPDLDKTMPLVDDRTMPLAEVESNNTRSKHRGSTIKHDQMLSDELNNRRISSLSEESNRTEQIKPSVDENGKSELQIQKPQSKSNSSSQKTSSSSSSSKNHKPVLDYHHDQSTPSSSSSSTVSQLQECIELVNICGKDLVKLGLLGKGGSSIVYRVLSPLTGALYAFKKIEVKEDDEWSGYMNEINLLKSLKGSNHIIELIDAEINSNTKCISMLMELGDVDLAKVLTQRIKTFDKNAPASSPLNPFFARMVWSEMLESVDYIHQNRIVHGKNIYKYAPIDTTLYLFIDIDIDI